jgi:chromosome segregation ATPase
MSETPKVPPPAGYKSWLDFAAETISGDYFSLDTLPGTKTLVAINWAKRELDDLRADLGDAATYRDAVRSAHNGYYAEMRDAMPELREPESPAAAISDLVQTAEEDGAMQERLRWEPELAALRAERDQLLASATSKEHRLHELRTERDDLKRKLDELKASIPTIWWEP